MKITCSLVMGFVCIPLITACIGVETRCGYQKNYQCPYYGCSKCGPKITYRCDRICDTCAGNEASCPVCLACISHEGPPVRSKVSYK